MHVPTIRNELWLTPSCKICDKIAYFAYVDFALCWATAATFRQDPAGDRAHWSTADGQNLHIPAPSAAWTLSWREFQRNFVSIAMLAVGLVSFTVLGLAMTAGSLLPGFDWKSAGLLGAVVAATDAIAATSIARRVGLPQRIVHILEAESLVNDGTILLGATVRASHADDGPDPIDCGGGGRLMFLIGAGVMIGIAIGGVVALFERWVDDGPIEIESASWCPMRLTS
jgi:Sodium/hydrogen exchanger family